MSEAATAGAARLRLAPRWRKVWRDLGAHRGRSALVVCSIAVGVFAVGTIAATRAILARDLTGSFEAISPASATISTLGTFDEAFLESVRRMPAIGEAEGRTALMLRLEVGPDEWRNIQLYAIPDFRDIRLDRVLPDSGAWPPPERTVLLERSGLGLIDAGVGDRVVITTPTGKRRSLQVSGTAVDVYALPYTLDGMPFAYVTYETLDWLGQPRAFNELHLRVAERRADKEHIARVLDDVRDKIEGTGTAVFFMTVPEPGKHPLDGTMQAILLLLGALGVLALALSGLLVTNTMAAVLAQEVRAIGMMKAIGASGAQLVVLYLGMAVAFGALALAVALPASALATWGFSRLLAGYLNLDLTSTALPPAAIALQALVALAVPLAAALGPVLWGTRVSVREAITAYGLGRGRFGRARAHRLLGRIRRLPRPAALTLRNTFRRRGRLLLTLTTLSLAGAMFIAVLSIHASIERTLDDILQLYRYDIALRLTRSYRVDRVRREAQRVGGVVDVEGWGFTTARHITARRGTDVSYLGYTVPLIVFAPPADSAMLDPPLLDGRWLVPADENALVVSPRMLRDQPGLDVGGEVTLRIEGRDTDWVVVGVVQGLGPVAMAFANYDYFSRVVREAGRAEFIALTTRQHGAAALETTARRLEERLSAAGIRAGLISTIVQERAEAEAIFTVIVVLLLGMVLLLTVVGALGLAGTMGLSVYERTREIGVMRAIGASSPTLLAIFVGEGVLIGVLSWLAAAVMAFPLAGAICIALGQALLGSPMAFAYAYGGALVWLAVVIAVSALASLAPARHATGVSVREVLAYE